MNYHKASDQLFLSASAIHRQIALLEGNRDKTISKKGAHIQLSEKGRECLEIFKELVESVENFKSEINDIKDIKHPIKIQMSSYIATYLFPEFLSNFSSNLQSLRRQRDRLTAAAVAAIPADSRLARGGAARCGAQSRRRKRREQSWCLGRRIRDRCRFRLSRPGVDGRAARGHRSRAAVAQSRRRAARQGPAQPRHRRGAGRRLTARADAARAGAPPCFLAIREDEVAGFDAQFVDRHRPGEHRLALAVDDEVAGVVRCSEEEVRTADADSAHADDAVAARGVDRAREGVILAVLSLPGDLFLPGSRRRPSPPARGRQA